MGEAAYIIVKWDGWKKRYWSGIEINLFGRAGINPSFYYLVFHLPPARVIGHKAAGRIGAGQQQLHAAL